VRGPALLSLAVALLFASPSAAAPLRRGMEPDSTLGETAPVAAGSLSEIVDPDQYRVGPGDQFSVWMFGPISRTLLVSVGPEGEALIPEIGTVPVAGLTLRAASAVITQRIRRAWRGIDTEIHLTRLRTFRVYVTGAVDRPGPELASGMSRVADLLGDSLLARGASHRNIEVRHADGSRVVVDLQRFETRGERETDPWLREGDVIRVPLAREWVGVWGAVGHPGALELGPDDSVSTLVRLSGGVLPSALAEHALLVRWRDATRRDTVDVRLAGDMATPDLALRDGDQIYVFAAPGYHESQQVAVYGRVGREGVYPIQLGSTRITQVIAAAGGLLDDADRSAVHLFRETPGARQDPEFERLLRLSRGEMTNSEYEAFRAQLASQASEVLVDWNSLDHGHHELDLLMQDGDVIRVERKTTAVRVAGQVRRPGLVPFVAGENSEYYLHQAGGLTRRASHTQIRLTRFGSGQNMLVRDAPGVQPGDQLWVPERPDVSPWQYLRDALVVGAQLATVWIAVRR
jgi:protein involved in polysaccharide export with SLBB domain